MALCVGGAWFLVEIALLVRGDLSLDQGDVTRRALELLPWQLALFAGLGLGVGTLLALRGGACSAACWWTIGAASSVFLGARVGEGLLPRQGGPRAVLAVAAVGLGVAVTIALVSVVGRALPRSLREAWPLAAWSGWTLLFLCFLRRAGPALADGTVPLRGWLEFVEPGEAALAAGVAMLVLLAAGGARLLLPGALGLALLAQPAGARAAAEGGERAAARPDVVVVLIDTYRFDHLGANVGRDGLTPNLDDFARGAIRFTRAFSPSNNTSFAMPGVIASLPATITRQGLPEEVETLADRLRRAGYRTLGVSSNPYFSEQFGFDQGFDVFFGPTDQPDFLVAGVLHLVGVLAPGASYGAGVVDAALYYPPFESVRRRGLWLLDASPAPTFLYLHVMDLHGPYLPPKEYLPADFSIRDFYPYHRFLGLSRSGVLGSPGFAARLRNLRQRYEGGVRYADAQFGRLVQELRARGRWDESLVWVLSDHGEAFGERDFAGHGGPNLTSTLLRVPLLLKPPRRWGVAARVETTPVSTLDLAPTTLGLLGEPPVAVDFGRDQRRLVHEGPEDSRRVLVSSTVNHERATGAVIESYSAIDWPWKLDVTLRDGGVPVAQGLFQLEEDPGEERDRSDRARAVAARLETAIGAWRALEDRRRVRLDGVPLSPRVREQLRQLGYVE